MNCPEEKVKGKKREASLKGIEQKTKDKNACYVLITCGHPSKDGKMQVEMTYEGDPTLAAYLIESAQGFFEEEEN